MGIYNLSANEIADSLEEAEEENMFEGDFTEHTFLKGAKIFIKRLRKRGASIPK